ncbi:glycosyltransferase [Enterococcus cecorum]|uniref:glycosyltransferase n=1 Tax=Enterococcus cecorum TaxID=44008 RepID=UPI0032C44311
MPKVSIVLPTYNGEKYIRESIESILSQTLNDWELIIVNDCSTDVTPHIIQEFADKDTRIHIIHNEVNQKLPNSLNIGFRQARGEYLTWTSDDNYYLPTALAEMVYFLEQNPEYPMVCAEMDIIDHQGNFLKKHPKYDAEKMYFDDYVGACFMYKKEVLDTIGEYNTELFLVEDYEYWLRILEYYGKIGVLEKILYKYRTHGDSLTLTRTSNIIQKLLELRFTKIDFILNSLYHRPEYLVDVFYQFYFLKNIDMNLLKNRFEKYVPLIANESNDWDSQKKWILYGAGNYGRTVAKLLGDKVAYFVDNDSTKYGQTIDDVKIISVDEFEKIAANYNVCFSLSSQYMYEVMNRFSNLKFVNVYQLCEFFSEEGIDLLKKV